MPHVWRWALAGCVAVLGAPTPAQAPTLAMLESLCLTSGRRLIQLRHPAVTCESYIVDDTPNDVTVQYTCRGRGYGRTHIHRESGRLVQVETQGIAEGFPFEFAAEGRRIGDCPSTP